MSVAKLIRMALCMAMGVFFGRASEAPGEGRTLPEVVVPRCSVAPVVDGRMDPGEWDQAAAFSGLVTYRTARLAPIRSTVYLTHSASHLYVAFVCEKPGQFIANVVERDGEVCWDDSVEMFLNPHPEAADGDLVGTYHFLGNSIGTVQDVFEAKAVGRYEPGWSGDWQYKASVAGNVWTGELAIAYKELGVPAPLPGARWNVDICRSGLAEAGVGFTSWAGVYGDSPEKGRFVFRDNVPVFQFTRFDPIGLKEQGKLSLGARVRGDEPVAWQIRVVAPDGKAVVEETLRAQARPAVWTDLTLQRQLALGEGDYALGLEATGEKSGRLYLAQLPFTRMTNDERAALALQAAAQPGAPRIRGGYMPYYGRVYVEASVKGTALEKEAAAIAIAVTPKGKADPLGKGEVPVDAKGAARGSVPVGDLKEGDYVIAYQVVDRRGKTLLSQEEPYRRIVFPWEHTREGKEDVLIPPFTAMSAGGGRVECILRRHTLDGLGLFRSVEAQTAIGRQEILAAPMQLVGRIGTGDVVGAPEGPEPRNLRATATRTTWQGKGRLGPVEATVDAVMEYDGFTVVTLRLVPPAGGVELERLTLRIAVKDAELWSIIAEGNNIYKYGEIPREEGVVWDSLDMSNGMIQGNIIPYIWMGTSEKGFTWLTDTDRGYGLDDRRPCQEIVRVGPGDQKTVELRVHLINKKVLLKEPRQMQFALLATPVKPLTFNPRRPEPIYYCGGGDWWCDFMPAYNAYLPHREKAAELDAHLKKYVRDKGAEAMTIYQTTWHIPRIMPETEVFRGEWRTWVEGEGCTEEAAIKSYHSPSWLQSPDKLALRSGLIGPSLCPSDIDCRVWYWGEFLKLVPTIVGQYWDNCTGTIGRNYFPEAGMGYVREDGSIQPSFGHFARRELLKRMAVVSYKHRREPRLGLHTSGTWYAECAAFLHWHVTGESRYITPSLSYLRRWPMDDFRTIVFTEQFGVRTVLLGPVMGTDRLSDWHVGNPTGLRTALAQTALHDIWEVGGGAGPRHLLKVFQRATEEFGLKADDVEFIGYWRSAPWVRPDRSDVKVSLYRRSGAGRYFLVVVNAGDKDWFGRLWLHQDLRQGAIWDAEARYNLRYALDGEALRLFLRSHDHQVISVARELPPDVVTW